jgi:hypothetical protein
MWLMRPRFSLPEAHVTQAEVQQLIITRLIDEYPASFLITGYLDVAADITRENTRYLFPDYFDDQLSLGTTRSTVRLPGRVSYGVDLTTLEPESISFESDSIVVITLGAIEIQSVEADLENMQIRTEVGWARLSSRSGRTVEREAILFAQKALREQATKHMRASGQPVLNTETALAQLLVPVLQAAGIAHPQVKFRIAPILVTQPPS